MELLEVNADEMSGTLEVNILCFLKNGENVVGEVPHRLLHIVGVQVLEKWCQIY